MKKIIKLTESDLKEIVEKVLNEQASMFGTAGTEIAGYRGDDARQPNRGITKKPNTNPKPNINPSNLKKGDGGRSNPEQVQAVNKLQSRLIELGLLAISNGKPTGYFGDLTQKALDRYNDPTYVVGQPSKPSKEPAGEPDKETAKKVEKRKKLEGDKEIFLDCVKNSPKKKSLKLKTGGVVIEIDGHTFYGNQRAKLPSGKMSTYYCYKNGVKLVDGEGGKTYLDTGVETTYEETSKFSGGFKGFLRKSFPNVAQILFTRPLTSQDFTEDQKYVAYSVIQNAINKRNENPRQGCTLYIDYGKDIDQQLNKTGGATTAEMLLGSGFSDEFRVATLLGRFCYKQQPNGSYFIQEPYDFSKWKSFTVKKSELEGKSYPEKIGYIMDKTGLSPYGAIRHLGYLEHPDNAPEASKTKVTLTVDPGVFAKNKTTTSSGQSTDAIA